jgi:hypothetical protein
MEVTMIDAVRKLVDAVIHECCTSEGGEDPYACADSADCARTVLKEILAAPELVAQHEWAAGQLKEAANV